MRPSQPAHEDDWDSPSCFARAALRTICLRTRGTLFHFLFHCMCIAVCSDGSVPFAACFKLV